MTESTHDKLRNQAREHSTTEDTKGATNRSFVVSCVLFRDLLLFLFQFQFLLFVFDLLGFEGSFLVLRREGKG